MDRRQNPETTHSRDADDPPSKRRKEEEERPNWSRKEEEERPNWSKILPDILEAIAARLHIGDRIQASRVCRPWRSVVAKAAPRSHPATYGNPCVLTFLDGNKTCLLSDPLRKEDYVIETPSVPEGAVMIYANDGWLLMATDIESDSTSRDCDLFFFNPLTRATIELPRLGCPEVPWYTFSFSSQPTSSDCAVVGMQTDDAPDVTDFHRWVPGAKEWETLRIDHPGIFTATNYKPYKPFLSGDTVYHLDTDGWLGVYDLSGRDLTVIRNMPGPIDVSEIDFCETDYFKLLAVYGELVFVHVDIPNELVHLFQFDHWSLEWIALEKTGTVFCSPINCMFVKEIFSGQEQGQQMVYATDLADGKIMGSAPFQFKLQIKLQTLKTLEDAASFDMPEFWLRTCLLDLKS